MQLLTEEEFAQLQPSQQILGDVVSVVFAQWRVSLVSCKPASPCGIFLTCVISIVKIQQNPTSAMRHFHFSPL